MRKIASLIFKDTPAFNELPNSFVDPGCGEKEALTSFVGKDWRILSKNDVQRMGGLLSYIDAIFLRYFLPGVLLYCLENDDGPIILHDIMCDFEQQFEVNGLTYDFEKRWGEFQDVEIEFVQVALVLLKEKGINETCAEAVNVLGRLINKAPK